MDDYKKQRIKSREEEIIKFDHYLSVYKHGVSDGLLGGVNPYFENEKYVPQLQYFYKKGHEFGVTLWNKQQEQEDEHCKKNI